MTSLNGQQQPKPEHPDQAFDQRELYPPLPQVPPAPQLPLDADPWGPDAAPSYEAPQAHQPPATPVQTTPIAMYVPPRGEDMGGFFTIQHAPVTCASCPPFAMIGIGQEVYVRTNPQGIKEYRHPWHVPSRRW